MLINKKISIRHAYQNGIFPKLSLINKFSGIDNLNTICLREIIQTPYYFYVMVGVFYDHFCAHDRLNGLSDLQR